MKTNKRIRELFYFLLRATFIPYILRRTIQRNTVTILVYHNIRYETVDLLFRTLKKRYNFISLSEYIDRLYDHNGKGFPERAIIFTLDDGYLENYRILPLAVKYGVKPAVFLCSGVVDTNQALWFNVFRTRKEKENLKKMPDEERISLLNGYQGAIAGKERTRAFLNKAEIAEMKGIFEFQSHTITHPILGKCSDEKSRHEIFGSKRELEDKFGVTITALAYPNGSYGKRETEILKDAGYKCGLTLETTKNNLHSNPYTLSRIPLNDDSGINEIIVKASGFYDMVFKRIFPKERY